MKGVPLNEEIYNYIVNLFAEEDEILQGVVKSSEENGLPLIHVSPENGKFLYMLVKIISAKRILEVGTLAGYSTIWMARALPEDGKLITLEVDQKHAHIARENFKKAGLEQKIELILGSAAETLKKLKDERFDFAFIDADKVSYPLYFDLILPMMNRGGIIAADNTLRKGDVLRTLPQEEGTEGVQIYNKMTASDTRVISLLVPISDGVTVSLVK
jgi:predicted O-methyltransferase YrrM